MAGHHNHVLHEDPGLIKYAKLNTQRYRFFRWTKRTAKFSFLYVVAFPALVGTIAYSTEGKYMMRGKRRGDIISEF